MPDFTDNQGVPVPVDSDDPNVPGDWLTTVEFLEHLVVGTYATEAERNTKANATAEEGQMAFTRDNNRFWYWNGTTWVRLYLSETPLPTVTVSSSAPSGGVNGDVHYKI